MEGDVCPPMSKSVNNLAFIKCGPSAQTCFMPFITNKNALKMSSNADQLSSEIFGALNQIDREIYE